MTSDEEGDTESGAIFPQFQKVPYQRVFHLPGPDWQVDAIWDDAYFQAAKALVEGVARGEYMPALEGVAGVYLFRHYFELALKFIIFHSRWLIDAHANARDDEIQDVRKTHSLKDLWTMAKEECQRVIADGEWRSLDIEFIDQCVLEFDAVDVNGERFRYHGERFGIERDPIKREALIRARQHDLCIDFQSLCDAIRHVHDVLRYLDVYMVETYGQNEEWQSILESF